MVVAVLSRVLELTWVGAGVKEERVPVAGVVVIVIVVAVLACEDSTVGWLVALVVPVVGVGVSSSICFSSTPVVALVSNRIFGFFLLLVFESHRGWRVMVVAVRVVGCVDNSGCVVTSSWLLVWLLVLLL